MSRRVSDVDTTASRFPRVSGDEPTPPPPATCTFWFSPRERG